MAAYQVSPCSLYASKIVRTCSTCGGGGRPSKRPISSWQSSQRRAACNRASPATSSPTRAIRLWAAVSCQSTSGFELAAQRSEQSRPTIGAVQVGARRAVRSASVPPNTRSCLPHLGRRRLVFKANHIDPLNQCCLLFGAQSGRRNSRHVHLEPIVSRFRHHTRKFCIEKTRVPQCH